MTTGACTLRYDRRPLRDSRASIGEGASTSAGLTRLEPCIECACMSRTIVVITVTTRWSVWNRVCAIESVSHSVAADIKCLAAGYTTLGMYSFGNGESCLPVHSGPHHQDTEYGKWQENAAGTEPLFDAFSTAAAFYHIHMLPGPYGRAEIGSVAAARERRASE